MLLEVAGLHAPHDAPWAWACDLGTWHGREHRARAMDHRVRAAMGMDARRRGVGYPCVRVRRVCVGKGAVLLEVAGLHAPHDAPWAWACDLGTWHGREHRAQAMDHRVWAAMGMHAATRVTGVPGVQVHARQGTRTAAWPMPTRPCPRQGRLRV